MFGKNEIVGQKYFQNAPERSLLVTSMFYTLQGEGPFRGHPAFFIRLSKCNLACSFCDTYFDSGEYMNFNSIHNNIERTINDFYRMKDIPRPSFTYMKNPDMYEDARRNREMVLVLTGGEPMLQKNIGDFLEDQGPLFQHTQIESNGIIYQDIPDSTVLVVSPKCVEKKGKAIKYIEPNPKVLARANCLKFVMEADPESPYSKIPHWAHVWAHNTKRDIYISPMNIYNDEPMRAKELRSQKNDSTIDERSTVDEIISFWEPGLLNMEENQKNHEYAAQYCVEHGFILNLQLHLYASLA